MKTLLPLALLATAGLFVTPRNVPAAEMPFIRAMPVGVKALKAPGLNNFFAVSTNVYSGSSPESEESFATLARLGVKTIISVDGAKPNVELAHKHGLRYVHIPHGYDGVSAQTQAQLVKAARTFPGPVFVHCHHGLHRGPAAVAVICMANNGWTPSLGEAWLKAAGTGSNYSGLYQTVREFRPPTAGQLAAMPSEFPETVRATGLVDSMVAIDERWELLKAVRKSGYQTPRENPDVQPAHEAMILWEHYREAQRLPESARRGEKFLGLLKSAEYRAKEAEQLLRQFVNTPTAEVRARLDRSFDAMAQNCSSCHQRFRDAAGKKAGK